MDPDRLLQGLDATQRQAVASEAQPLAILAGAGSGKTRVLTRRIAYRCAVGTADPRHVLAVTFTRKAASELDQRLRSFGLRDLPAAGTFHALAYAQLRARWAAEGTAAPGILDRKGRFLARILGGTTRVGPADLAAEIEWAKARLVAPERYPLAAAQADRRTAAPPERMAEWYRRYEEEKRRRGVVDFDDLLALGADAIEADPTFAASQRWRFRHLFVDEYQDLNPLQERLLRAWLGDRKDLCVVGDPNQAIYGWNGADPSFLTRFAVHHPGATVVALRHSYRSSPEILATAAAALGPAAAARPPEAHRPHGPVPVVAGFASDLHEANGVARAVRDLHGPGRAWSAQAVLIRTNAQATLLESSFRRAGIPYRVRGSSALLDDPDVRDLLRTFDRTREPLSTTLADLRNTLGAERDQLARELGAGEAGVDDDVLEGSAAGRRLLAREHIWRLGHDLLLADAGARTDGFAGWLRATLHDDDRRADAVEIVSFHAAKGLEWPVVHVTGLEAGLVPIAHARTAEARAEERRLLYVAITRAAEVLRCTWAQERTFGTRTVDRRPSPFLTDLQDVVAGFRDPAPSPEPESGLAASRAALAGSAGPPSPSSDLRAELRAWRTRQARAADVAPTVVLSDRALEAVAQARPRTDHELAEVAELGPLALLSHGATLLEIVATHPGPDDHPLVPHPHAGSG